jgi:hypothetical protein
LNLRSEHLTQDDLDLWLSCESRSVLPKNFGVFNDSDFIDARVSLKYRLTFDTDRNMAAAPYAYSNGALAREPLYFGYHGDGLKFDFGSSSVAAGFCDDRRFTTSPAQVRGHHYMQQQQQQPQQQQQNRLQQQQTSQQNLPSQNGSSFVNDRRETLSISSGGADLARFYPFDVALPRLDQVSAGSTTVYQPSQRVAVPPQQHQDQYRTANVAGFPAFDSLRMAAAATAMNCSNQYRSVDEDQKLKVIGRPTMEALAGMMKQSTVSEAEVAALAGNRYGGDEQFRSLQQRRLQPDHDTDRPRAYVVGSGSSSSDSGSVQHQPSIASTAAMPIYPWMRSLTAGRIIIILAFTSLNRLLTRNLANIACGSTSAVLTDEPSP